MWCNNQVQMESMLVKAVKDAVYPLLHQRPRITAFAVMRANAPLGRILS